ncbi:Crp/Fnr family transcriptional regulator [Listeria booriae]|uniref:Crp/Fnr family transcriptional regulator n=1 Tax=Listeria booriae TaxID=1552123 RepID=A0A7X1A7B7_9LIST|nr:Crp/Fnr family transcriptional regulator [Listeria booriae]MBC2371781.1 Crp/Fnr family transcriptional regulator [Listeria booriae]
MYEELNQLYDISVIQNKFNQEKFYKELICSGELETTTITIKKDTFFSQSLDLGEQICFLQDGIACTYFQNVPTRLISKSQFLNVELIIGMEEMDIEAFTTCTLLVFNREEIMEHLFSMQEGVFFLFCYEKEKKNFLFNRVNMLHQKGYPRLLQLMEELAEECGTKFGNDCILPKCLTIKRLAALSSLSTHTVSLFHEKMIHEKIIQKEGGRIILLNN